MPDDGEAHDGQLADIDRDVSLGFDSPDVFQHDLAASFQEGIAREIGFAQIGEKGDEVDGLGLADLRPGEIIRDRRYEVWSELVKTESEQFDCSRAGRECLEKILPCEG